MLDEFQAQVWDPRPAEFLRKRGLAHSTVARFGLGYTGDHHKGEASGADLSHCLVLPYEDGLGRVRQLRYRPLYESPRRKYLSEDGDPQHLFAVRATEQPIGVICEGEIDAMTAWQCGVKAVAVPGAQAWKDAWKWLFRNCRRVVLAMDPDEAGLSAARAMYQSLSGVVDVAIAPLPQGMDLNDLLVHRGERAVRDVLGVV